MNVMHSLRVFLVYFVNLYMFRAYLGHSSGGTTACIQQFYLLFFLEDSLSSNKNSKYNRWIHTFVPPDGGPRYARNM